MPYIEKNSAGRIVGVFAIQQKPDQEFVESAELWKSPLSEIGALESGKPFTHRALRELSKTVAQMAQAVTGIDPLTNPEVAKIFELDADITVLRDQAKLQGLI